jgi:hypothetical protein
MVASPCLEDGDSGETDRFMGRNASGVEQMVNWELNFGMKKGRTVVEKVENQSEWKFPA